MAPPAKKQKTGPSPEEAPDRKQKTRPSHEEVLVSALQDPTIIEIRAGEDDELFTVHRELACYYSSYFRALTNNTYAESLSSKIDWSDEDADIVRLFVEWLYSQVIDASGRIPTFRGERHRLELDPDARLEKQNASAPGFGEDKTGEIAANQFSNNPAQEQPRRTVDRSIIVLSQLWILGDKRGVPGLQNAAINAMHKFRFSRPSYSWVHLMWAWESTRVTSKLHDFIVEWLCIRSKSYDSFNSAGHVIPNAVQTAIIRRLLYTKIDSDGKLWKNLWRDTDLCRFHEHPDGFNCRGETLEGAEAANSGS